MGTPGHRVGAGSAGAVPSSFTREGVALRLARMLRTAKVHDFLSDPVIVLGAPRPSALPARLTVAHSLNHDQTHMHPNHSRGRVRSQRMTIASSAMTDRNILGQQ